MARQICPHCGIEYYPGAAPKNGKVAECCGKSPCWELQYWTPAEWALKAEMAAIRLGLAEAGVAAHQVVTGFSTREVSPTRAETTRTFEMVVGSLSTMDPLDLLALRKLKRLVAA